MERYSKYKVHTEDTYAKLLKAAFEARGIYDSNRHDTVIMAIAPLFVRLEQARKEIVKYGVLIKTKDTNQNDKFTRNPAIDIEIALVDRIRKTLKDMNLFVEKRVEDNDEEDNSTDNDSGDPLAQLTAIMGGVEKRTYRKQA